MVVKGPGVSKNVTFLLQYSTNSHGSEGEVGCLKAIRMLQYSANSHGSEGIDI